MIFKQPRKLQTFKNEKTKMLVSWTQNHTGSQNYRESKTNPYAITIDS